MNVGGRFSSVNLYRYGFNGMEKDDEVSGSGNSYTTFYRLNDPRIGRWRSVDPKADLMPWASTYVSMGNNPILATDPKGDVCIPCITAAAGAVIGGGVNAYSQYKDGTLDLSSGESWARIDRVAHMSGTYADHPEQAILDEYNPGQQHKFRKGIDYSPTKDSQKDDWHNMWHAMRSTDETADGMTSSQAHARGLGYGWSKVIESAFNSSDEALGQGLHALQDAYAHKGASTEEHLGKFASCDKCYTPSAAAMLYNDMYGNTQDATNLSATAMVVYGLIGGDASGIQNLMSNEDYTFDFSGLNGQKGNFVQKLFNKAGYSVNFETNAVTAIETE